jgi:2-oxoglutarate/2-oxoacid ferredoxin oxidoreductase subunit alpha
MKTHVKEDLSIVLSGEAGQGLQTLEQLMLMVFKFSGYHVHSYSEYMSRIRGGNNSTQIRVSGRRVMSYLRRIDIFVPLHAGAMQRFRERITRETVILGDRSFIDKEYLDEGYPIVEIPLAEIAKETGGAIYINVILLGIFSGLLAVDMAIVKQVLKQAFGKAGETIVNKNFEAAEKGYEKGAHLLKSGQALPVIAKSEEVKSEILMTGVDAVGMGALAGGCNFVSSYPMSPSTGVLIFCARNAKEFDLIVEQAEDEISAVNMALGSWYAGGRALVTTSGGGYALMVEAMSLTGCIESPLVIHLGQRPGPSTGLPTRTEQADLEHVLYSGHGEFPRLILAPGTFEEGYRLTAHAFHMADKYQIPVFILTDQLFLESGYSISGLDVSSPSNESFIARTEPGYKRYQFTDSGISPRGIPGFGEGFVCVDSDEHDEIGNITEDFATRTSMVEKRLRKLKSIEQESIAPTLIGAEDYRHLVVGWGSTRNVVQEALDELGHKNIAFLHFSQVYPLHPKAGDLIRKAGKKIIIENNATSQFGKLIRQQTGIEFDAQILKFNGMPFMVEEVTERLETLLQRGMANGQGI